jgi:hypothetical protein
VSRRSTEFLQAAPAEDASHAIEIARDFLAAIEALFV